MSSNSAQEESVGTPQVPPEVVDPITLMINVIGTASLLSQIRDSHPTTTKKMDGLLHKRTW